MTPVERLLAKLPDAKQAGNGWSARCPAHEDRRASLSIGEGEDGRALVNCHAGCKLDAICAAVGLRVVDLMPTADKLVALSNSKSNGKARIVAQYDYCDESGNLQFQVVRMEPKDFRQRRPNGKGGWNWSVKGTRIVPYRLPELLAQPSRPVVVVEGEKDCNNLAKIDLLATCNAGGAGKWTYDHSEFLRGRGVIILPDNDEAGRKHAQQVAQLLDGIAEWVCSVELPGLPNKGDVSDWIASGGTKGELKQLIKVAPKVTPTLDELAESWLEIISFDVLKLPDFPTHALPTELKDWVEAESHATQTPPDLAALLAMSVCSACIARRVVVEPRPGWREPVNLYTAILLDPGNRKSAVFSDAMKPLREVEAELVDAERPEVARAQSARRQDEARLRNLEKKAAEKGDAEARHEAGKLAAKLAEEAEPALPRLLVDDATSEKLGMMLEAQGGRIASMSPEGGVFDLMAGLYSKSGIPQFGVYLMAHSGDDLITDRVTRPSIRVERPALTCAYAMQPAVIEGLAENTAFRGRGLLARFLYAAPRSWIGEREIAPKPVSDEIKSNYYQAVRELAKVTGEFTLELSPQAEEILYRWETAIEEMLGDGGEMEIMRDWGAKLAGASLRLAAVIHCLEHGTRGKISESTMAAAIEIANYMIPHAEAVLDMMLANEENADDDAQYVLRWIERHKRTEFSKTEAQHHGKRRFPEANDIDPALSELVARGYIRPKTNLKMGPGRPKSPAYEVNPDFYSDSKTKKGSRDPAISFPPMKGHDSRNIGSALELSMDCIDTAQALIDNRIQPNSTIKVCRCGSRTSQDVPIHGGQSSRRDCSKCGRTIDFPIWYGENTGQIDQQTIG